MKDRVKAVRQAAGLTQAEFADVLNMSVNAVSQMERDVIKPSVRTRELICDRFDINREWLETGIGDMKKPPLDEVAEIVSDVLDKGYDDPIYNFVLAFIKTYQELEPKDREFMQRYMDETLKALRDVSPKDTEE